MANYSRGKPDRRTKSRGRSRSIRMSKVPLSREPGLQPSTRRFSNEAFQLTDFDSREQILRPNTSRFAFDRVAVDHGTSASRTDSRGSGDADTNSTITTEPCAKHDTGTSRSCAVRRYM